MFKILKVIVHFQLFQACFPSSLTTRLCWNRRNVVGLIMGAKLVDVPACLLNTHFFPSGRTGELVMVVCTSRAVVVR
ncbi:hypothetical protein BVRB_3g049040 [Beta vulgaris subsp. vulgaris]|nr:hypothetical protein BVRB_3g049040 [Beta vulgaris subsp. vulgaris]